MALYLERFVSDASAEGLTENRNSPASYKVGEFLVRVPSSRHPA